MRALVLHKPGDLRLETREAPGATPDMVQVRILAGGICGSDLHYYQHGGFGAVKMVEPMILGHEVAGRIIDAPEGSGLAAGDLVAVSPSRNCGTCQFCVEGLANHCENMRFYGSAMPVPHIQGAFRDVLMVRPDQCHKLPEGVDAVEASTAEPLAVALHSLTRAGPLVGRRLLVTGCGPIGALVLLAARAGQAAEVVVTDVTDVALQRAEAMGATRVVNTARQPDWADTYSAGKATFDIAIEASGAPRAFEDCLRSLRPRGVLVMLGLGDDLPLARNFLLAREIDLRGSFRFHEEFGAAVDAIATRRIDVRPILSRQFPLGEARAAFEHAGDRTQSLKVHLDFAT